MCLLAAFSFQILYFCNSKVNEELRMKNVFYYVLLFHS